MAHKRRRSSHDERIQAITLLEQGYTKPEVAKILQVAESSVYSWQAGYRKGGLAALSTKIASGRKSLLSDKQMLKLSKLLRLNPRQLEFNFGLWTRKRVRELIRREFEIDYTEQNVGRILKMLGFSPQRPVYRALQRNEEHRGKWMNEIFPALKARADREGASIFFADEAGCRNDHHSGTTWAPVGETPVVDFTGKRESIGMVSAVSMRGKLSWMTFEGSMNSALFIDFMRELLLDVKGKVFLVLDNVKYHKSRETTTWVEKHSDRIELFYLPGYSPDLNPDEWVWKNVKNDNIARVVPTRPGQLFEVAEKALRQLRNTPEKVRSFFSDPHLAYISCAYSLSGEPPES
ncbi:MAG: IS630 family transposase [Candidatus Micrarchaeaceae archaeon]